MISYLTEQMKENFRQLQLEGRYVQGRALVSKKGKADIKARETKARAREDFTPMLSHNRKRNTFFRKESPCRGLWIWGDDSGGKSQEFQI